MAKNKNQFLTQLGNPGLPMAHRCQMLIDVLAGAKEGENADYTGMVEEVFQRLQDKAVDEVAQQKLKILDTILKQLEGAPLRPATFIELSDLDGLGCPHALVTMGNGETAYIVAHDQVAAKKLHPGDAVMVDASMKILMHPALSGIYFGGEARLERKIDDRHIEVTDHQDHKLVVLTGSDIIKEIDAGKVSPGSAIVLGSGNTLAVRALPTEDKVHYRFLDRGPVPDVLVDRDIGSPPKVIEQVARHIKEEMTRPEIRRRFRLRPCITRLLCGVSGTGKTLARMAIHRRMYEIMSEVTRTPIEELPPRVFVFRVSKLLSMWLGESDKNIDRMFDEVEQLADTRYTAKSGKEYTLPVMVVMEEADGMGRARGQEAIYDRILTTLLQRLDPNRLGISSKLVVFLSTTNEPHIIDPAFLRRIGGSVETFGRLDQDAFTEILLKHTDGLPLQDGKKGWRGAVDKINHWLFDEEGDPGVVELVYQGSSEPIIKYRRDFLTGALIDRAVQEAATQAWELAIAEDPDAAITVEHLAGAINHQVQSVVQQLCVQNISSYLDIPEGVRVTNVRRIPQRHASAK